MTAAIVFPFIHYRSLAQAPWLMYVGVGTILVVNLVIIIRCVLKTGRKRERESERERGPGAGG